ncbi:MAG: class I SAM-dependent methyltransferase [Halobacteriota archaeon]
MSFSLARRASTAIRLTRNKMLRPYYRRALHSYSTEPWFARLIDCQREIAAYSDTTSYYADKYQAEEIYYWLHIPKWLYHDYQASAVRYLDIGCAFGVLALYAKELCTPEVYCTDMRRDISSTLIRQYSLHFVQNNIELDPLPWNEPFDVIVLSEVIEHFNFHPLPTLKKIRSLLVNRGRLYLSTPDATQWGRTNYYKTLAEIPQPSSDGHELVEDHIYQFNRRELLAVLKEAGFTVERCAYAPGVFGRHFNLSLICK